MDPIFSIRTIQQLMDYKKCNAFIKWNKLDGYGKNALFYHNNIYCLDYLIHQGADPHVIDHSGRNLLFDRTSSVVIKYFLHYRLDINKADFLDQTPIFYVKDLPTLKLYEENGANLFHKNTYDQNILDRIKNDNIKNYLIERGLKYTDI